MRVRTEHRSRSARRFGGLALAIVVTVVGAPHRVGAQGVASPPSASDAAPAQPQFAGPGAGRRGPVGGMQQGGMQPPVGGPRQMLEQRLRMRFEQIVRQRLQLTNQQVAQLRASNQRFAPQRRALNVREREIRQSIRTELQPGVAANEQHVSALTDSLFAVQRSRLEMLQSEQRDLATFLTPSQRVRYYALQEQLRRRVEALRQRQGQGPG